jgi:F0F1-type ATP synthase delta subunit
MQASRGAVKVTIISADALKKKQLETIQAGIMSMVGAGKSVSQVRWRGV